MKEPDEDDINHLARVCHETNRGICEAFGDISQKPWKDAPDWQKHSAIQGVKFIIKFPYADAPQLHEQWMSDKKDAGWKWGPIKDEIKLEHPCMIAFVRLPPNQKAKDLAFQAIVKTFMKIMEENQ